MSNARSPRGVWSTTIGMRADVGLVERLRLAIAEDCAGSRRVIRVRSIAHHVLYGHGSAFDGRRLAQACNPAPPDEKKVVSAIAALPLLRLGSLAAPP